MTSPASRRQADLPPGAPAKPTLFVVAECECGAQVAEVRGRDGGTVRLDLGADGKARRDPAGQWWPVKVAGQWRVVRPQVGEEPPAGGVRYAGHECPAAGVPAGLVSVLGVTPVVGGVAPVVSRAGRAGPCAGGCGVTVPRLYGADADLLCPDCRGVLVAWRAVRVPHRPPIPYGRLVDGVYRHPPGGATPT